MNKKLNKSRHQQIQEAKKIYISGDLAESKIAYEKLYNSGIKNIETLSRLSYVCMDLGNLEEAFKFANELSELQPNNINVVLMISVLMMRMGYLDQARSYLNSFIEKFPNEIALLHNLHSVESGAKNHQEAVQIAMRAIQLNTHDANAYNNLGASLHALGLNKQAKAAFEMVITLSPTHGTAHANLALISSGEGNVVESITALEKVLKIAEDKKDIANLVALKHNIGFQYLRVGRLKEGWEYLENGFSNLIDKNRGRRPQRSFKVPQWRGEPLNNKPLLVWREQGLGDEILFATCLKDLEKLTSNVIVECERRLIDTFSRSFPAFTFRLEAYYDNINLDSYHNDFEFHIPIGSLCGIFRNEIADFINSKPYIVVDEEKKEKYSKRIQDLNKEKEILNVGICWRSATISPGRNSGYTILDDWDNILKIEGINFINLQYGKCEEELISVEERLGISIARWTDLNLQNDLDDVCALISCLDVVVTVETAVNTMSAAVGIPVMTITPQLGGWPNFGTDYYPFFPNVKCYFGDNEGVIKALPKIAQDLKKLKVKI